MKETRSLVLGTGVLVGVGPGVGVGVTLPPVMRGLAHRARSPVA